MDTNIVAKWYAVRELSLFHGISESVFLLEFWRRAQSRGGLSVQPRSDPNHIFPYSQSVFETSSLAPPGNMGNMYDLEVRK